MSQFGITSFLREKNSVEILWPKSYYSISKLSLYYHLSPYTIRPFRFATETQTENRPKQRLQLSTDPDTFKVTATSKVLLQQSVILSNNKNVLLRERKRHTDRRVASPGGGVDRQTDGWTDTCENITFPHPSDTVGKYSHYTDTK